MKISKLLLSAAQRASLNRLAQYREVSIEHQFSSVIDKEWMMLPPTVGEKAIENRTLHLPYMTVFNSGNRINPKCVSVHVITMTLLANKAIKMLNGLFDGASGRMNILIRQDW